MQDKQNLRASLRTARRNYVEQLPASTLALMFHRPPVAVTRMIPEDAIIGLYHASSGEAPAGGYARYFFDAGHKIALPFFEARNANMQFRSWPSPYSEDVMETGPWGVAQPGATCEVIEPDFLFVPLLGFTPDGDRLGQGGGHYDRWFEHHIDIPRFGLAWDCQMVGEIPLEPHDIRLDAIITPTRLYGPF